MRIYQPLAPDLLSSASCAALGCQSFTQIPSTNVIFSLASYPLTCIPIPENQPRILVTLGPAAAKLWTDLQEQLKDILAAVKALRKMKRGKPTAETPGIPPMGKPDAVESEESGLECAEEINWFF